MLLTISLLTFFSLSNFITNSAFSLTSFVSFYNYFIYHLSFIQICFNFYLFIDLSSLLFLFWREGVRSILLPVGFPVIFETQIFPLVTSIQEPKQKHKTKIREGNLANVLNPRLRAQARFSCILELPLTTVHSTFRERSEERLGVNIQVLFN